MGRRHGATLAVLAAFLINLGLARGAWALSACTAAQISSQESACPSGTGPCTISHTFDVGDGCILDFGARAVTLTGKLLIGFGSVTFKSGSLMIPIGGRIDGVGDAAAPNDVGGKILVMTSGAVTIQGGG